MLSDILNKSWTFSVNPLTDNEKLVVEAIEKGESTSDLAIEEPIRSEVISLSILNLGSEPNAIIKLNGLKIEGGFDLEPTQHPITLIINDCEFDFLYATNASLKKIQITNAKMGILRLRHTNIESGISLGSVEIELIKIYGLKAQEIKFSDIYSSLIMLAHLQELDLISFRGKLLGNIWLEQCDARELDFIRLDADYDENDGGSIHLIGIKAHDVKVTFCKGLKNLDCRYVNTQVFKVENVEFIENPQSTNGITLEDTSISQELRFRHVTMFGLSLKRVSINKLFDDEESWVPEGNLYLQNISWNESEVQFSLGSENAEKRRNWLRLQNNWRSEGYEQLAIEESKRGNPNFALSLRIEAEKRLREWDKNEFGKTWSRVIRLTTGYGYQTSRIVPWALLLWLIGSIVAYFGHGWGVIAASSDTPTSFSSIGYSLDTLIPIVRLNVTDHWVQTGQGLTGTFVRVYFWVHVFAGWLIGGLAAASLAGFLNRGK